MKLILVIIYLNAGGIMQIEGRYKRTDICEGRAEGYRMQSGGRWQAYCALYSYGDAGHTRWTD